MGRGEVPLGYMYEDLTVLSLSGVDELYAKAQPRNGPAAAAE